MNNRLVYTALFCLLTVSLGISQTDKDMLALTINSADEANTKQLMQYIWKRKSAVAIEGEVKLNTVTEFSFSDAGELQTKLIDAESSVKEKAGIRGRIQENAAEDKTAYVQKALDLVTQYTFMTKGELLDFFGKATVTTTDAAIEATAADVFVKGDKVTLTVDPKSHLYIKKSFSSFLDKDPINGEINYGKFSSGINHGTTSTINLPGQKMVIQSSNEDYSQRVK